MSQRVKITRARLHGSAVYLGEVTGADGTRTPVWSANPDEVVGWLCDGLRFRFNQRRSTRCRYLTCQDRDGDPVMVIDPAGEPVLVPIGNTVTDITDAQARRTHSFLAAMPGYVLEATLKTEATDWFSATKRRKTNTAAGRRPGAIGLGAKQARVREDFAHKLSTQLVRGHDFIGIEKLSLDRMSRRGKGKGAAAKRGLNRVLQRAALGRVAKFIQYKANLAGVAFVEVPAAYTSQRCHQCGHTCKETRESQAVFRCLGCAWTGNADTNAALNVREEALTRWAAHTEQLAGTSATNAGGVAVSQAGSKSKTDPHTGPAPGPAASAMNREPPNAA